MSKFIYVAAFLGEPDAEQASFHNSLIERVFGVPQPDVIAPYHPSCIRFRHAVIEAESKDDAYNNGWAHVEHLDCASMNDYVIGPL